MDTAGTLQVQASTGQPPATSEEVQINVSSSGVVETTPEVTPPTIDSTPTEVAPVPTEIPDARAGRGPQAPRLRQRALMPRRAGGCAGG